MVSCINRATPGDGDDLSPRKCPNKFALMSPEFSYLVTLDRCCVQLVVVREISIGVCTLILMLLLAY